MNKCSVKRNCCKTLFLDEASDSQVPVGVAITPIEEVTNALYDKSKRFALTHDVDLRLPEMIFDGATFRISPRSFEGNGMLVKLELIPKQFQEARLMGKILSKLIRKCRFPPTSELSFQ